MWYWVRSPQPARGVATVRQHYLHGIIADRHRVSRAALCQVYDSIFMDVPMSRVKFNVNTEYAYIQNFKILQSKWILPCSSPESSPFRTSY
jgi:hypothetical protein